MAELQGLILSADELRKNNPTWSDPMVEDYLTIPENATAINAELGEEAVKVAANTASIATNTANIATNTTDITTNTSNVTTNTADILTNATNIGTNTTNIGTNTTNIALKASKVIGGTTSAILVQSASGDLVDSGDLIADLLTLDFAGNPETNVTSNKSRLC